MLRKQGESIAETVMPTVETVEKKNNDNEEDVVVGGENRGRSMYLIV